EVMAGPTLSGSADRVAGRSARLRAASARADCAVMAARAMFRDRVSIMRRWSAPMAKGSKASGWDGGGAAAGSRSGVGSGAGFAALGLAAARGAAFFGAALRALRVAGFFGGVAMNGS